MAKYVNPHAGAKRLEQKKKKYINPHSGAERNKGGLAEGVGYVAGNLGLGLAGVGEGILDIAAAGGHLMRGDVEMAKNRFLDNKTAEAQQDLTEWYNPGKGMQFAGDVASGIGQSSVFLLDALVPGLGTGLFFGGVGGQGVSSAAQQTGNVGLREIGYGVASGAAEAALGKLVGAGGKVAGKLGATVTRSTGKAIGQKGISTALTKAAGKKLAGMGWNVAKNTLADAASEFTEEFAAEYVDTGLLRAFGIDPDATTSFGEAMRAGAVGLVSGAAMGAPANVYNYKNSAAAGKEIRESGDVSNLLYRAAATVDVLKEQEAQAREQGRTKATVAEDAGTIGKATAKGKQAVANLGAKIKASKTKGYWSKLEKNINAYTRLDEATRNSEAGDALLGELRGNLFFTNMSYAVEEAEETLKKATDEEITEWLVEINAEAKKAGNAKTDYTVEDFRANRDGILSQLASAFWIDNLKQTAKDEKTSTEPSQTAQEAAGATEAVQAEEVAAEEKNAAETEEQGLETDPWESVEGIEGFGTQNKQEEALLRSAVSQGVPKKTIPAMLDSYREGTDLTPAEFADAWADGVMLFGRYGLNEATVSEESNLYRMSEKARRASIREGKSIADEETRRAQEKAEKKKMPAKNEADAKRKQESGGKIIKGKGLIVNDLKPEQYAAYKAAEALAHVLGTDIEIETSLVDTAGKQTNGYYDPATNKLHININAKRDGKSIALYTLGHEVSHYIKEWSPAKFRALSDFVMEHLGKDAEGLIAAKVELLRKIPDYKDYTVAQLNDLAAEEVVADGMELVLADGKIVDELARTDESIWKRMKDFIKKVISDIKKYFSGLNQASKTAQVLRGTVESLDEIEQLFYEGVVEAGERTRTAETVTGMNEENMQVTVKYKTADDNNESSIKEQIKKHASQLESMTAVDKVAYSPMNKKKLHEKVSEKFKTIGYKVERQNFGTIEIGEKQIDKSINYINSEGEKAALFAIPAVLKRGIVVDGHDNHKGREYNTVTIAAPIEVNGTRGIVGAVVTKIDGKNKYRVHRILTPDGSEFVFDVKRKDAEPTSGEPLSSDKRAPIGSASKRSISQDPDSVNRKYSISEENSSDTRYSIDETPKNADVSENETEKLKAENEELTKQVQRLRYDRFRQAVASGEIDARERRRELSRGVDKVLDSIGVSDGRNRRELMRRMSELYGRMAGNDGISYEQAFEESGEIAEWLISAQPAIRDAAASEQAAEILKTVTGAKIRLTYNQKTEIAVSMGSTEAYRKAMFGRIALSDTDGVPLDQQWAEWSELYPDVFPKDISEADMPERLMRICKNLKDMRDRVEPVEQFFDEEALTVTIFTEVGQIGWSETKNMPNDYTLLAESLAGTARNVHEYKIIKDFKATASELQEAEDRRRELKKKAAAANKEIEALRKQIKEAGDGDTSLLQTELDDVLARKQGYLDELDELEDKIVDASKKLLSVRATAPLRRILAEEVKRADAMERKAEKAEERAGKAKERAEKRAERAEERSKEYRETMDRKVEEASERKEMTSRKRTIVRVLGSLQTKLLHPTKTNHAPKELHDLAETIMKTADPKAWDTNRKNIREMGDLAAAIEKLERQATRTAKEQERLDAMKSKYEILESQTMPLKQQAEALYTAYKQYNEKLPEDMRIPESVMEELSKRVEEIENAPLKEMGLESLKAVETFVKALSHQIDTANELFVQKRGEQVSDWGNAASREAAESKPLKWLSPKSMEIKNKRDIRDFLWKNMKPLTAFEAIGSPKLMELFHAVLDGEEVWITDVMEAREVIVKAKEKYGYDSWDLKTRREFTTAEGKVVRLTVGEMMSLYAYAKREQAMGHLRGGGFVLDAGATEITEKSKIRTEKVLNLTERYTMTEEDMGKLAGMLTEEQKQYATAMQNYLTSLGEKGNEISRKLYGLDLFNEEHYFPIKVKSEYLESNTGKTGDPKIKNRGMAKETEPDANNPLVLQDFMTIVSGHVNDMATYHAFVLPVEDLTRVLNYQPSTAIIDEDGNWTEDTKRKGYSTLKSVIESKYGAQANAYIEQLIRDLNGGARREAATSLIDKGITAFKRASTMASLSVLIQQPTSIFRAMAYLDPKYFRSLAGLDVKNHKEAWEQMKKYAPVAAIKEMGGYDTGVGARTADYLNSKDYKTWGDKAKAFFLPSVYGGDANYRAEIFGKGAAYADEMAWIQMFDACKREQAEKLGKPMDSEEVLEAAGKRFTEVVRRTQVYDATLARSEYMRSKDTGMKMATAFMAEPTTVVSMMMDGFIRYNRGDKAFMHRTAGAVATSVVFNALLVSLIYAARDDDEEKTFTEKYLATVATETAEGFNPLEYLPYTRDIMSLMKGYDIERTDMALFADLFKSLERITSSKRSVADKATDIAGAVSSFFGIPVKNILRDVRIIPNIVQGSMSGERTTGRGISSALTDEFSTITNLFGADTTNGNQMYNALRKGDTAHYERVASRYKTPQAAELALRDALRSNDRRIAEAAEARAAGELEAYESIVEQIEAEGIFDRNIVLRAINNELSEMKELAREDDVEPDALAVIEAEEEENEPFFRVSDLTSAMERGDKGDTEAILDILVTERMEQGKTEAQARAAVKSGVTAYWKKQYLAAWEANQTAEMKRILELLENTELYGDYNDVATMAQNWIKNS